MADEFIMPYKGMYIRIVNSMFYIFDDAEKRQPNEAVAGCCTEIGHAKRLITLRLKGHYWNSKPTKCSK
jgi:hypothetical protein